MYFVFYCCCWMANREFDGPVASGESLKHPLWALGPAASGEPRKFKWGLWDTSRFPKSCPAEIDRNDRKDRKDANRPKPSTKFLERPRPTTTVYRPTAMQPLDPKQCIIAYACARNKSTRNPPWDPMGPCRSSVHIP